MTQVSFTADLSVLTSRLDRIEKNQEVILKAINSQKPAQPEPPAPTPDPVPDPQPAPLDVILAIDFTKRAVGTYTDQMFKQDFQTGTELKKKAPASIEVMGGKPGLISHYPKDTWGDAGGYNQVTELKNAKKLERARITYSVYFEPGFDFGVNNDAFVNKFPGLGFGPSKMLGSGGDGFRMKGKGATVRVLWEKYGQLAPYVYHHGTMPEYGDNLNAKEFFQIEAGKEYTIEIDVITNTVGKANGVMVVRVNGVERFRNTSLILRTADSPQYIESLCFATFMGGGDSRFKSPKNQKMALYKLKLEQL
jgi:hypothetical protein